MQQQDKNLTAASVGLEPAMKAASMICGIKPYSSLEEDELIEEVNQQVAAVVAGNMTRSKSMMAAHAETLDALFYSLLSKAQKAADPHELAALVGGAVKAHEGCRSAVESLATFKRLTSTTP